MPTRVPPPGLLSTTNCCPSTDDKCCAIRRANKSLPPPGVAGTTIRTVRLGKSDCAAAGTASKAKPTNAGKTSSDTTDLDISPPSGENAVGLLAPTLEDNTPAGNVVRLRLVPVAREGKKMAQAGAKRPLRIVIVGAGIGGLAAAVALRQRGFEVEVHERSP